MTMWPAIKRAAPPVLLAILGIGLLIAGSRRGIPVLADEAVEVEKLMAPPRPPEPPFRGPPGPGGAGPRPPFMAPPPPPMERVLVTEIQTREQHKPESQVLRDVTVGGIERLADGRLKMTYKLGEKGPALCPT